MVTEGAASLYRQPLTCVAEGHVELVSNIRPKLSKDVETHACREGIAAYPQGGSKPAFVPRMINVVEANRGHRPQPLRDVEHVLAAVALRHKCMLDCMEETLPAVDVNQAVYQNIARDDLRERIPVQVGVLRIAGSLRMGSLRERIGTCERELSARIERSPGQGLARSGWISDSSRPSR